jgi:hypothetical protein
MNELTLILVFFALLAVLFGLGTTVGRIFGLDKYLDQVENKPHVVK